MAIIRVTKEFDFEIAHALWEYDGPCQNIHGHSYRMFVTVLGNPLEQPGHPKNGMVIDFGDLKQLVKKEIVDKMDHTIILNKEAANVLPVEHPMFKRKMIVDYQPTCENLVADFAERLKKVLPENLKLFSIKLHETATSFAEWYASDND